MREAIYDVKSQFTMSTIVLAVKMQSGYTALIFFFLTCIVDISLAVIHVSTTEIFWFVFQMRKIGNKCLFSLRELFSERNYLYRCVWDTSVIWQRFLAC